MSDINEFIDEFKEGFSTFQNTNQKTLNTHQEGINALTERMEQLEASKDLPGRSIGIDGESPDQKQYRECFTEWLRSPHNEHRKNRLSQAEQELLTKDVNIGTPSAGGYALPEQISSQIIRRVTQLNPFRELVRTENCSTNDFKAILDMGDATSGWSSETGTRTATNTPTLRERAPTMGELYAYVTASNWAVDDLFFNVERWLVDSVAEQFAAQEATAIVSGDGSNKPTGLLNTTTVTTTDDASPMRAADALQYVTPGNSPLAITYNSLVSLVYAVKERYLLSDRTGFVMARTTASQVRQLVDSQNRPLWTESMAAGQPPTLLGYPVWLTDAWPAYAVGNDVIGFGAWDAGYLLADRTGMRIIVDQVTAAGLTKFYISRRLGGIVLNNDAVKTLKLA